MRTAILIFILMAAPMPAAASRAPDTEEIPLSRQLEGLGPRPRLAYLRHLLSQGRKDAELMFQTAVAFHELGDADSALHYYDQAIALDPEDYKSYVNRGVLFDERGDYAHAIKSFATAVTINPGDVLAHSHLAFLLNQNGDHRAAWRHLHEALTLGPDDPQPHFYLAIFFWEARIYREATREWEKVIELEPDGFLAAKARENIVMLQNALESPSEDTEWRPSR
jgi:Flp pilus assembly protein TadD